MSPANAPLRSSWQELYQAALAENDREKLTGLVGAVESAIVRRRQQLIATETNVEEGERECAAMIVAAEALLKIKTEKLGWPAVHQHPAWKGADVVEKVRRVESIHHWHPSHP
jgi:hypothetical protein